MISHETTQDEDRQVSASSDRQGQEAETEEVIYVESEEDLERLELEDQATEIGKLSVREYATLRGMAPQLVYYYIRNGHVKEERCVCGRKVIDVKQADEVIAARQRKRNA